MTNHTDPVALLEQVYDHAEGVLAEIGPDHHELPTPCTEWNVHELANHARIDRAMRHKWLVATALFGMLAPVLGAALVVLALVSGTFAALELVRGAAPPVLPAA